MLNKEVLSQVYLLERDKLIGFIRNRIRAEKHAQDVLQDVYLKVQQVNDEPKVLNAKAYLYRLTNNLIIDYQRRQIRSDARDCQDTQEVANHLGPEQRLEYQQQLDIVQQAMAELPDKTRRVFELNRVDLVDKQQVAQQLEISVNMVEKHLRKAIQYCRHKLASRNK